MDVDDGIGNRSTKAISHLGGHIRRASHPGPGSKQYQDSDKYVKRLHNA